MVIFNNVESSNPRTGYVCLFVFTFFHQDLNVLRVQVFASLGRFIPRYFILFDVMVNGIVSYISL